MNSDSFERVERFDRRDYLFLAICIVVFAVSLAIALTNFTRAFPEASIEFKFDRKASRGLAERFLGAQRIDVSSLRNTAIFDTDDPARIFLERTLGLERAQTVMKHDVRLWFWHQRWFRPLQEEEYSVDVAPTGEIVAFTHKLPEDRPAPPATPDSALTIAGDFLRSAGVNPSQLTLVDRSERKLPRRIQRLFTWESKSVRPAGAAYRYRVAVDGTVVTEYAQRLRVPEQWQRSYHELRSKNQLAGQVDTVFLIITIIAGLVVFIIRIRRGDVHLRFLFWIGIAAVILVTGVALNSYPAALAGYDTTASYGAFLAQFFIGAILQSVGTAMFLVVICGSGEVLYRERLPQHLAIPRLWSARALGSKRVFRSFVLAYAMVAFFLAYQVVFYLTASKFGAWAPAEIPYDDILNSALPWVAVLFAGFFPGFSEEFMSRAFSIPLFERLFRSRIGAIVVAAFIWGFGHATYPNQPFYIRGVEVGCAGILLGFILYRFGLLPLLIWHYTVDAVYTALLLFRSHNTYYVVSGGIASLVFVIPMLVSLFLYFRRGGFVPDDDLSNATLPVSPEPPPRERAAEVELPPAIGARPLVIGAAVVLAALAAIAIARHPPSPSDAFDYRVTRARAREIATDHLRRVLPAASYTRVIATPVEGFRSWDRESRREDGGSPGGFDATAAEHMLASGLPMPRLIDLFRTKIEAGTWSVRFFTPMKKEEFFVEVDPRSARAIGFHEYLDERTAGPRLEQPAALAIAMTAFAANGADPQPLELEEALSFQQPNRRDWLFHFQERQPIVDHAFRRVTIRVCGNVVTQFATTVKVPDAVYRAATTQTLRNVVLAVLRIGGGIALLAAVIAGFVGATLRRRPRWMLAFRWMLFFAPLAILSAASGYEAALFGYNTSVRWETFFAGLGLELVRDVAVRVGVVFLAVAAIDAVAPSALATLSAEGRRRFGRAAVVAGVTAVSVFTIARSLLQLLSAHFPAAANIAVDAPSVVAAPLPALLTLANALFDAVVGAGLAASLIAGFTVLLRHTPALRDAVAAGAIFCAAVDPSAMPAQMPLMLTRAAVLALLAWFTARHILGGNVMAWPVAIFTGTMLSGVATLAANHRPDLQFAAAACAAVTVTVLIWLAAARRREPADA